MKTQMDFVLKQLMTRGYVTRNQCLERRITRLGARISDLKQTGFNFIAGYEKTRNGQDYKYTLIKTN